MMMMMMLIRTTITERATLGVKLIRVWVYELPKERLNRYPTSPTLVEHTGVID